MPLILVLMVLFLGSLKIAEVPLTWVWVLAPLWIPALGYFTFYALIVLLICLGFGSFVERR